jgi:hypothetical protein
MSFKITFDETPYNPAITKLIPIVAALAFHWAAQFKEPYAHHFVIGLAISWVALTHTFHCAWDIDYQKAFRVVLGMFAVFTLTVWTSMTVYRIFFHPLRKVPGPISCKISMWSWVLVDWFGQRAKYTQTLHQKFGDEVRVGPREISCADPAAITTIYGPIGPSAKAIRGPWYTGKYLVYLSDTMLVLTLLPS